MNFRLQVVRGGQLAEVDFAELLTRRTVVSIYMRNNTPSCDRQVQALADHAGEFAQAGYDLVALSRETGRAQLRFAAVKKIDGGLVLAADPQDLFAQAADAVVDKVLYGRSYRGPARAAFLLAPDATVLAVLPKVDPKTHAAQLRVLCGLPESRV